jgi:UDP-2-acetamido-2-deoxy-ribo-hexuluronate aminotransferase
MKQLILDTNIILDYFIEDRETHKTVKEFLGKYKNKVKYLIASYQYDTILYLLRRFLKTKNVLEKFENFLKEYNINIVSTTGKDNLNASKCKDIEKGILISVCKRIGENCFIITNDKDLIRKFDRAVAPTDFALPKEEDIPMLDLKLEYLTYAEELEDSLLKASVSAKYILGDEVKRLEKEIANYIGTKYAVGVSSGTDALVLSLRALAIKNTGKEFWDKEDLIITTPFTFTATGEAILRAGATPLFVDIDLDTYTINPELIEKAVKKYGSRVKGIIPVHLYGHPANMDEIMRIAKENNLFVVEDCAQSFGAKWDGKFTGSFGDTGCFSFFPSKNLGAFGDGGMITTNDEELYELLLMLRKHGGKDKYNVEYIGYNARLDTIQAAILLVKLKYIDEFNERRRKIAYTYNKFLSDIKWLKLPFEHPKAYHVYHQYTVQVLGKDRDNLRKKLKENNISTMVYYPIPLHQMKVFIKNGMEIFGELKNSKLASNTVLSLFIEPLMEPYLIEETISKFRNLLSNDLLKKKC